MRSGEGGGRSRRGGRGRRARLWVRACEGARARARVASRGRGVVGWRGVGRQSDRQWAEAVGVQCAKGKRCCRRGPGLSAWGGICPPPEGARAARRTEGRADLRAIHRGKQLLHLGTVREQLGEERVHGDRQLRADRLRHGEGLVHPAARAATCMRSRTAPSSALGRGRPRLPRATSAPEAGGGDVRASAHRLRLVSIFLS